jgi:hypothetical protein
MKIEYAHTFPYDFYCENMFLGFSGKNQNFSQKRTLGFAMLCSFTFAINTSNEKYRKTQKLLTLVKYIYIYIYSFPCAHYKGIQRAGEV